MAKSDRFDYEEAELDILDAGGDPDYLSHYNTEKRDNYIHGLGLNPDNYRPSSGSSPSKANEKKGGLFDSILDDFFSYDPSIEQPSAPSYYSLGDPFPIDTEPEKKEPDDLYEGTGRCFQIDEYGMEQLAYLGYDQEDVDMMTDEDLHDAMEDAGLEPEFYEL